MTVTGSSGGEPPHGTDAPIGDDNTFFGAGQVPIFVQPTEAAADSGGDDVDGDDDELDSEFAPQARQKLGPLTIGLAALLVAGAGFLGGLQVQQHEGSSTSSSPFPAAARGTAAGAGGFAGGFGGRAGTGAGGTSSGAGAGAGGTGAGAGSGNTSIPAVIGQIVSVTGDTVIVRNLGGQLITVKLSGTTTITQTATAADLKAGQNVTVSGTTGSDGTVTATAVGAR